MVVIESTGCYSQLATRMLTNAGYQVAVVQPGRIRHYARSQGQLAKTDRIDARIIAQFGEHTTGLRVYQEPSTTRQRLRALVDRRDQVVEDRVREGEPGRVALGEREGSPEGSVDPPGGGEHAGREVGGHDPATGRPGQPSRALRAARAHLEDGMRRFGPKHVQLGLGPALRTPDESVVTEEVAVFLVVGG